MGSRRAADEDRGEGERRAELAKRFRAEPLAAMLEVATQVRAVVVDTLERVMDAEIDLVIGEQNDPKNRRNGHANCTFQVTRDVPPQSPPERCPRTSSRPSSRRARAFATPR